MTTEILSAQPIKDYTSRIEHISGGEIEYRGLSRAVLKTKDPDSGYYVDLCTFDFERGGEGKVTVKPEDHNRTLPEYEPTPAEAEAIKAHLTTVIWPKFEFINLHAAYLPDLWQRADEKDRWAYRDENGEVVMLQVRKDGKRGKAYIPITRWGGRYEYVEPDTRPIFNLQLIRKQGVTTVFLHEGAKAARAAQAIADDDKSKHPWKAELSHAVHLGVMGGAASISKTDFSILKRLGVTTYYVVPDNDEIGKRAGHQIAKRLSGVVYSVQVGGEFPTGWDFADDMPTRHFSKNGIWTGPTFNSTIFPATQATYPFVADDGKTRHGLQRDFAAQWYFVNDTAEFVHRRFPEIQKTEKAFNDYVMPFSAVSETAPLLKRDASCHIDATVYRPGKKNAVLVESNRRLFNVYRDHDFPAIEGEATPWREFMAYLLPADDERAEFERWLFTLLGSPETRMNYSCLMFSEAQGTGKTIVADTIFRIIGPRNCAVANPKALDSQFNSHFENRRCVIFNELYEGGSNFKTTNALKTVLTDDFIHINSKYRQERTVENHTHIFAASNSSHALDLDDRDRRWLVVSTTNTPWPKEKFAALRQWLFGDVGCNILLAEARKFRNQVGRGERAPVTGSKKQTILQSKSEIEVYLEDLHAAVESTGEPSQTVAIETSQLQAYLTRNKNAPKSDSLQRNVQRLKDKGWAYLSQRDNEFEGYRPKIDKRQLVCVISPELKRQMQDVGRDGWNELIRPALKNPADLCAF